MATFHLRRFANVDALKTIQEPHLRRLLAPYQAYFTARGVTLDGAPTGGTTRASAAPRGTTQEQDGLDYEGLIAVLLVPDDTTPPQLIDALYLIHEMATLDGMENLLEAIRRLSSDEQIVLDTASELTPADVAVQVWLKAPQLLERKHAEQFVVERRSFDYYLSRETPDGKVALPERSVFERIERDLAAWFFSKRKGDHVRVLMYPKGDEVWFLVRHGEAFRREGAQKGRTSSSVFYRPEKHDVLVYNAAIGEFRINASSKGEKELYLQKFGLHVFGDPDHFPRSNKKYSLEPLKADGPASLVCTDVDGIDEIRLTEITYFWGGVHSELEIRKAGDLFAALQARGGRIQNARIVSATFQVKFRDSKSPRSVTIRQPNVAKFTRDDDGRLIETWLLKRGFSSTRRDAHEEAEAAVARA